MDLQHIVHSNPECMEQERQNQDEIGPKEDLYLPSSPACASDDEGLIITGIRVTGLALGLERIPAGFYTTVHHSGHQWRTETKPVFVDSDVVEWTGPIPIPSDLSAGVSLVVYATFEFQPRLGSGEQLRELTTTVEQLLHCSAKIVQFTFLPDGGHVISPYPSLLVTVRQRNREDNDPSVSADYGPHHVTESSQSELEETTDKGHSALARYRKHGGTCDLENAIQQFQHALNICSLHHPCYVVAQANLASAKLIHCRVSDASFDVPIALYRNALSARSVSHPDRARTLVQLATVLLARFEKQADALNVAEAETLLREVMALSSIESHEHQAAVSVLRSCNTHTVLPVQMSEQPSVQRIPTPCSSNANQWHPGLWLFTKFEQSGNLAVLQEAITVLEATLRSNSLADQGYFAGLVLLGTALCYRFLRRGDPNDLEDAISKQRHAVHLSPNGHSGRPRFLTSLGSTLFTRFQHLGELCDLLEAILRQRDAIQFTPNGHPLKPTRLSDLGASLYARFLRFGKSSDLEEAILMQRDAADLTPNGHPHKPRRLNRLGASLRTRFERLGHLLDLEEAISKQLDAIRLVPDGRPHKFLFLNSLGNSLLARFRSLGKLSDLEDAVFAHRKAVDLSSSLHPDRVMMLINLGNSLLARFECLGEPKDLEEAISKQQDAIHLIPDGNSRRSAVLNNLGNSFLSRFLRLGEQNDLEEAILRHRDAVDLTPDDHLNKPTFLSGLGTSFRVRFGLLGSLNDLEEAILRQREAVRLIPDGHPEKPSYLNELSVSIFTRFQRLGNLSDLGEAISSQECVVSLTPDGHPHVPLRLNNLGNTFRARFELLGELDDLEQAVSRQKKANDLVPEGHPDRPGFLTDLGNSLFIRFKRLGEQSDLEEAISKQRNAVYLTPDNHPDKPTFLINLGNSLLTRFEHLGGLDDLEDAILRQRNAINLSSAGDARLPAYLHNFSNSLQTRFKQLGDLGDLEEMVTTQRDAVRLVPEGHLHKPGCLRNLGIFLHVRFKHLGKLSDLEEAFSRLENAVDLTPDNHPDMPSCLNDLSSLFRTHFQQSGDLSYLEEAISRQREVIRLTPDDYPHYPGYLNNLGILLKIHFEQLGELRDLEQAISSHRNAIDLIPDGHPRKPGFVMSLADSFVARYNHLKNCGDLECAISLYSQAACTPTGPISIRFRASRQWILNARLLRHQTLFRAYSVAVILLPQLAWIGLPLSHRYRELMQAADIVHEAAAAALDLGHPETAIEWLEQGRSVVWGEMFQLRSSSDILTSTHPDHARRLRELSAALENASTMHEKSLTLQIGKANDSRHRATESLQQEAARHRKLAIERDRLLRDIRKLPGFERFLLQKEFSQLRASAHSGPLVLLNAAESRCDALIILTDIDRAIHVPLSKFTLQRSMDFQTSLKTFVRGSCIVRDDREGQPVSQDCSPWQSILASLWICVVKPVLDALAFSIPSGELSRIFWCPAGPFTFLPIHAAGFYDIQHSQPGYKVHDFVVSSYVPTLSILAPSPHPNSTSSDNLRLLAVRQPLSDGQRELPGAIAELEHINSVIDSSTSAQITLVEPPIGTVEEVLALMKETDWVHFACHGVQDATNPTESGLCLADQRRLKLSDAISLSRPRGGLAFLSACQTAKGDEDLSDEAIHIAAGMLFAGYGGVIGSMWSIRDKLAPDVARDVYEQLFRNATRPDCRGAATALHVAVRRLRNRNVSFQDWLPFIHVGL